MTLVMIDVMSFLYSICTTSGDLACNVSNPFRVGYFLLKRYKLYMSFCLPTKCILLRQRKLFSPIKTKHKFYACWFVYFSPSPQHGQMRKTNASNTAVINSIFQSCRWTGLKSAIATRRCVLIMFCNSTVVLVLTKPIRSRKLAFFSFITNC